MMTPTAPIYYAIAYASAIVLGSAFISEFVAELRDNKWNIVRTIIEFFKEF